MSTVTVITGIIILLAALVCYAFVSQTIHNKREQKKRLLAALKSQSRNFKFILNGFPKGFLTKELRLIVLRSVIEVSEQLTRLEPNDQQYTQDLKLFTDMLGEAQREQPSQEQAAIETPQQIKEIKMSLDELHRFIFNLEGRGRLARKQADAFRNQIKQLVLRTTVDGYVMNGRTARQASKTKLAHHYYNLALKLLQREGKAGLYDGKIQNLRVITEELASQLSEEEQSTPISAEDAETQAQLDSEWNKFSEDSTDSMWKKKQVYD